jgi:hypothetical protein
MRRLLLIAGVAALTVPGIASAQTSCREQRHDNRVAGTVLGAVGGALIGGAVAGHGSKTAGAVIGGVAGGAVGNAVGGASTNCDYSRTGYYDSNGVWRTANGYYDADGNWVDTRPPAVDYGYAPSPYDYNADVAYTGGRNDLTGRENWLQARIREGDTSGALRSYDADRDFRTLAGIRDDQRRLAYRNGGLSYDDREAIASRLDDLQATVRTQWNY